MIYDDMLQSTVIDFSMIYPQISHNESDFFPETLSLCSVAPSVEDLDEELAQYQHLFLDANGTHLTQINSVTSMSSQVANGDRVKEAVDGKRLDDTMIVHFSVAFNS